MANDSKNEAETRGYTFFGVLLSLLVYGLSLFFAVPLCILLGYLTFLVLDNETSVLPFWVGGGALVLYTVAFFYLVRRRALQRLPDESEGLISKRKSVRSQDWQTAALLRVLFFIGFMTAIWGGGPYLFTLLFGPDGDEKWVFPLMIFIGLTVMMVFAFISRRKLKFKPTDRVVLWLRRFHEDGLFPFELILEDACGGIALPLTVADTTVPDSKQAGELHPLMGVGAAMVGFAWLGGFSAMSAFPLQQILPVAIPLGLAGVGVIFIGKRKGGRSDLRTEHGRSVLKEILDAVDHNRPLPAAMTVVRMSDDNWKEWVGDFIDRADAVIMDVTHLTDSLGWELNACKEKCKPRNMILACGWYDDSEDDPWSSLEPRLEKFLGADFLAGCQQFNYQRPRKEKLWSRHSGLRQRRAMMLRKKYEQPLLACFSAAFQESRD